MKKVLLTLTTISFITNFLLAQNIHDKCGTMEYLQKKIRANPGIAKQMTDYEEKVQQLITQQKLNKINAVITIPVVFHIVYNADSQNLSDQRIYDQMAVTNRDFSGLNPHSMQAFAPSLKTNTGIQFCLAQKKPDGTLTNGIERKKTSVVSFQDGDSVKFANLGGMDAWDPTKYFNVWICNYVKVDAAGYIFSAYSQFPGSGLNSTYGIVIRYGAVGPYDSTYYRGNGGILNHELGHSLNLYHIWGDDNVACTGSDNCGDTPNEAGRTTGKHSGLLTDNCTTTSPGIMYMNFMDYSDDIIMANFTPDQVARMQANFVSPDGNLIPLSISDACSLPSGMNVRTNQLVFSLFPNPAKEEVTISINSNASEDADVFLFDVYGRLIQSKKIPSKQKEKLIVLDLSMLPRGIYFVEVEGRKKKMLVEY